MEMKRILCLLITCALLCGACVAEGGASIDYIELIEGTEERARLDYVLTGIGIGMYIDQSMYEVSEEADIVTITPYEALEGAQMTITAFDALDPHALLDDVSDAMGERGLSTSASRAAIFGEVAEGVRGDGGGMREEAYAALIEERTYLARIAYPEEAEEGYGARMRAMIARLTAVDEAGLAPTTVYGPDDEYNYLQLNDVLTEPTPNGYVSALYKTGAFTRPVSVLSASIRGDVLTIDLSSEFGAMLSNTGTAGEYVIMGSLVNTLLMNMEALFVRVLCEGAVIETGHAIYDEPLGFYE